MAEVMNKENISRRKEKERSFVVVLPATWVKKAQLERKETSKK